MKNTPENKAKFFAQYWGQKIGMMQTDQSVKFRITPTFIENIFQLELKPLSQITDEDVKEVARLSNTPAFWEYLKESYKVGDYNPNMIISDIADFLRSKSYALPYMGVSVEQQIEYGWIKLK